MTRRIYKLFIATIAVTALATGEVVDAGENWPQFRGPTGQGISDEKALPLEWGGKDKKNVHWQSLLPGEGHAGAVVWWNKVFTCTVSWPANTADRKKAMPSHHVTCFNASDGKQLWDTLVPPGAWLRNDFRSGAGGGYAAPTPTTDGKHLFCVFGSAVIAALDFDGKVVWRKNLEPHTFDVTVGSSPVLFGDTVIMLHAMSKKSDSQLVAFKKASGEVKWRTPMPTIGFAHSTPLIIDVKGKSQMLVVASGAGVKNDGIQSFDPTNGKRLWWCKGGGDASSPAYGSGIVYFDSGRGGPGFAVDPTGEGDVSKTHVRWTESQVPEAIGSPTIVGEHVYRLHSPGVLKVWKASDGTKVDAKRLEGLSSSWASPIADANGRLYFVNGGKSVVVQSGPPCKVLAVNDLNDANHASGAAANGRFFIVGLKMLHCVGTK